jgi:CRISPR-associated protein Csx17
MTDMAHEVVLHGVRPEPLASYLKGIGIVRLVAQQLDPAVRSFWRNDEVVLVTRFNEVDLVTYFLEDYCPTPIVSPWHGSCGFFPESATVAHLRDCGVPRFSAYGSTIVAAQSVLADLGITAKPERDQARLIMRKLRGAVPDVALEWLDVAFVLTDDDAKLPPLLGTGGNDGHLEYAHNFMQRLEELLLPKRSSGSAARDQLMLALFGPGIATGDGLLTGAAVGQFAPGSAGGANLTAGFSADPLVNPWDYLLLLEGAVLFAGAATRSLHSPSSHQVAAPFSVATSAAGYDTAATMEEAVKTSRGELWVPLWAKPLSLPELRQLYGEGKANVGGSAASSGIEFSIAVAALGVDRNIAEFVRYGFLMRNGLAYAATPLGRFEVGLRQHASLLEELVPWLRQLRSAIGDTAPASVRSSRRVLEDRVMEYGRSPSPGRAQFVLQSLVALHRLLALGRTPEWLRPVRPLSGEWIQACDDGSPEYALAFSVAAWVATCRHSFLRELVLPVGRDPSGRFTWNRNACSDISDVADPVRSMELLLRGILASNAAGDARVGSWAAPPADVAAFLEGKVDAGRTFGLICALGLVSASAFFGARLPARPGDGAPLPAAYCLLKPFFAPESQFARPDGESVPLTPTAPILAALERHHAGEAANAARVALVAKGFVPAGAIRGGRADVQHGPSWPVSPILQQRLFAGLLFPVKNVDYLLARVVRQSPRRH